MTNIETERNIYICISISFEFPRKSNVPLPRPTRGLQCIRDFNRWISRDCFILFIIFYIFSVIVGF